MRCSRGVPREGHSLTTRCDFVIVSMVYARQVLICKACIHDWYCPSSYYVCMQSAGGETGCAFVGECVCVYRRARVTLQVDKFAAKFADFFTTSLFTPVDRPARRVSLMSLVRAALPAAHADRAPIL
eukprot:6174703-Pleurochrysis_carterae.AAC.1